MAGRRRFEDVWTPVGSPAEKLWIHSRYSAAPVGRSPLVFIPGLGLSGRSILPTGESLSLDFPVWIVDLPGCGDSDRPASLIDLAAHASMLASWLRTIGCERAVWIGHSFGSQVAAELAVCHPEAVERLVLVSPTVDARARNMRAQLARLLRDATREPPSLLPLLARDYVRAGVRTLLHAARLALRDQIERKLPVIDVPTLVVRGEKDPLVPARWADEVTGLLRSGQLVVISGTAHAVHYCAPHQLARAIEDFCAARAGT